MMSQKRNNEKPPKLPPRDTSLYSHDLPTVSVVATFELLSCTTSELLIWNISFALPLLQPDYDDENRNSKLKSFFRSKSNDADRKKHGNYKSRYIENSKNALAKNKRFDFAVSEDPYYCGLSARVPKFDRSVVPLKKSNKTQNQISVPKRMSVAYLQHPVVFAASGNTNYQYPMKPQQQKQYVKQKNLVMPRQNYQQMMWHARSMESGLGKW